MVYHLADTDDRVPIRKRAGPARKVGPVLIAGREYNGPSGELTSPSHLFLPFLQAVQALAPRFGMCAEGWG